MTSKRWFGSSKKFNRPVGDKVPVIGNGDAIHLFSHKLSSKPPDVQLDRSESEDGLMWAYRYQGHHKSFNFHLVGVELGTRCPVRSLWKKYVEDAEVFVLILRDMDEEYMDFYFNDFFKNDVEFILNQHDTDKNILVLIDHRSEEEFNDAESPHHSVQAWMTEQEERHCLAHFHVCLEAGRGLEPALDWLTDHLSTPGDKLKAQKSRSPLHWLAEVGKKVLTFGAASKKAAAAQG